MELIFATMFIHKKHQIIVEGNLNNTVFTILYFIFYFNLCSCWAEASTGALSDRYSIATQGKLRVSLAPQQLLNFNSRTTGGSCEGGDHVKAYEFMHTYGISDDTCAAKIGLDRLHSFHVAAMTGMCTVLLQNCNRF